MSEPATPLVTVTIQNPSRPARTIRLDGLIDTGSDISAIPKGVAGKLGLPRGRRIQVSGIAGLELSPKSYLANLEIAGHSIESRRVIEWNGEAVIIARDLLSEFTFFYDGKNRRFELRDP